MFKLKDKETFNAIDLFSGIGGFHEALTHFGGRVVLASEIDKFANDTYKNNYKLNSNLDINKIDDEKVLKLPGKIHVVTAGFPCQSFSNAGKKMGFQDFERGQLIYSVENLIKKTSKFQKKPKIILLENVKHLINHNKGQTFHKILEIFRNLDYVTIDEPILISPHQLGVPQHRPRVIIPFILNETNNSKTTIEIKNQLKQIKIVKNKPIQPISHYLSKRINSRYVIKDLNLLKVFQAWEEFVKKVKRPKNRTLPVIWLDELNKNYSVDNLTKWKQKYLCDMRQIYRENKKFINLWMKKWNVNIWSKRDKKLEWQAGADNYDFKNSFVQLRQSGIRCRKKTMFPALVAMVQIPIIYSQKLKSYRRLMPREVANIQNFPQKFKIDPNDFQAYKQFGNAVNVEVIKYVFEKLKNFL